MTPGPSCLEGEKDFANSASGAAHVRSSPAAGLPPDPWLAGLLDDMDDPRKQLFAERYLRLRRDRNVSLALSLTLGPFGVDRFYVRDVALGVFKLLTFMCLMAVLAADIIVVFRSIYTMALEGMDLPDSLARLSIGLGILTFLTGMASCGVVAYDIFRIMRRTDEVNKAAARKLAESLGGGGRVSAP